MRRWLILVVLSAAGVWAIPDRPSAADPDPSDEQLQRILRRFPEADLNKDGKLTLDEAREFRRTRQAGKGTSPAADATKVAPAAEGTKAEAKAEGTSPAAAAPRAAKKARRSGDAPKPDYADVSYGAHPSNKLDLWLAKADKPTPLVVFIHGGGFVGGDKASASGVAIRQCLDAGVSFASINYRFRTEASINTVLRDSARAIQYLRYKAKEYNLDKDRVAAFGGSAGAGTSLWLAFHDDLADPKSDDPVLRESTRLVTAASTGGQATYDILKWRDVLGSEEAMRFYPQSTWPAFYGLKTLDDLQTEKGKQLRADVDMLGMITSDDPPVWLGAGDNHDALANKGDTNHSPKHSEAVKKRCDEVGVKCVLKVGNKGPVETDGNRTPVEFMLKRLSAGDKRQER
jgi:acetyl esterase/lipase